jgi:hypothetical protein
MKRIPVFLAASAALAALLFSPSPAAAQTPPNVGAAQSFAVVGGSSVTAAGTGTVINGDVGVSPGTSITGFPGSAIVLPPFATHANDGVAIAAQGATGALYTDLATRSGATPIIAELGGRVLTPGIYSFSSTANIASGTTLRLNGAGIYIFQVGSALTANVLSAVVLENGANACNIFWQVTSAATLNGVTFAGTVVAQAAVDLGVGASLTGRALTTPAGAVTMAGGNTIGGCSGAVPGPGCPAIAINPPTVPDGTTGTPYSQQFTGSGGTGPYVFTLVGGALPPGLTLTAGGLLAGTPTTPGPSTFSIRATDANGCFAERPYTMVINAAVPTLPQFFVLLLALALTAAGYFRLRRGSRAG